MFINDLREQVQYCISTECLNCKFVKSSSDIQKCKYLNYKIDELDEDKKFGKMSNKAKRKLWHLKGGVSRGSLQRGRRKKKY